jgi:peptide deformylase
VIRSIKTHPDNVLRRVARKVDAITDEIRCLCDDMVETMTAAHGVGLAANQVGVCLRVITLDTGSEKESAPIVIINPTINGLEGEDVAEEGCLSVPGFYESIKRAKKAVVSGEDIEGNAFQVECNGLLARAVQHEVEHLDGILFIDHLSPVKKQLFKREYGKEKK